MNTDRIKCYYIVDKYCMKHIYVYNMANPKFIYYISAGSSGRAFLQQVRHLQVEEEFREIFLGEVARNQGAFYDL